VEAVLRHACSALCTGLRQASKRHVADALHGLWLHAAVSKAWPPELEVPCAEALSKPLEQDDQVLIGTPRDKVGANVSTLLQTPPRWKGNQLCRSPFSEASTRATSSTAAFIDCVKSSAVAACAGGAQLVIVLERCTVRHLAWGLHRLQERASAKAQISQLSMRRVERRCEKLEASMKSQAAWRQEAEQRIVKMADRGEKLERERAHLQRCCAVGRKATLRKEQQEKSLRRALEEAEQATESLSQRTRTIELQGSEEASAAQLQRVQRRGGQGKHIESLAEANEDLQTLRIALRRASSAAKAAEVEEPADALVSQLRCSWQRERDQWAEACDELCRRSAAASEEAAAAQLCERRAEASAAAASTDGLEKARREMQSEAAVCSELRAQLETRLVKTAKINGELKAEAAEAMRSNGRADQKMRGVEGIVPELVDEVAAYQALLAKLKSKLRWEQSERQACDKALQTLRSSYSLLLSRVEGVELQ